MTCPYSSDVGIPTMIWAGHLRILRNKDVRTYYFVPSDHGPLVQHDLVLDALALTGASGALLCISEIFPSPTECSIMPLEKLCAYRAHQILHQ